MKYSILMSIIAFVLTSCATSIPKLGHEVSYQAEDDELKGYIASDINLEGKRPGILIVHEWWGHNEYVQKRADMLATEGYVAMAIDMYGEGKKAMHPKDAAKFSSQVMKKPEVARKRFIAAMETLKAHPHVDKEKIGAIGYCFGGGVVLSMAQLGVDLDAVASFHGSLNLPFNPKKGEVSGEILVLNGLADPLVKPEHIKQFKKKMDYAEAKYKIINYKGAKHAFTNPEATQLGKKFNLPLAYDEKADKDSWKQMLELFRNVF